MTPLTILAYPENSILKVLFVCLFICVYPIYFEKRLETCTHSKHISRSQSQNILTEEWKRGVFFFNQKICTKKKYENQEQNELWASRRGYGSCWVREVGAGATQFKSSPDVYFKIPRQKYFEIKKLYCWPSMGTVWYQFFLKCFELCVACLELIFQNMKWSSEKDAHIFCFEDTYQTLIVQSFQLGN